MKSVLEEEFKGRAFGLQPAGPRSFSPVARLFLGGLKKSMHFAKKANLLLQPFSLSVIYPAL
jgi:hypothetical protein